MACDIQEVICIQYSCTCSRHSPDKGLGDILVYWCLHSVAPLSRLVSWRATTVMRLSSPSQNSTQWAKNFSVFPSPLRLGGPAAFGSIILTPHWRVSRGHSNRKLFTFLHKCARPVGTSLGKKVYLSLLGRWGYYLMVDLSIRFSMFRVLTNISKLKLDRAVFTSELTFYSVF